MYTNEEYFFILWFQLQTYVLFMVNHNHLLISGQWKQCI